MQSQNSNNDNPLGVNARADIDDHAPAGRIARALYRACSRLPKQVLSHLNEDGTLTPHIEQYSLLHSSFFSLYLNRYIGEGRDRHLSDSMWNSLALVITGSLIVRSLRTGLDSAERTVRGILFKRHDRFYMTTSVAPETWTLFAHGRAKKATHGFLGKIVEGQASYTLYATTDLGASSSSQDQEPDKHVI